MNMWIPLKKLILLEQMATMRENNTKGRFSEFGEAERGQRRFVAISAAANQIPNLSGRIVRADPQHQSPLLFRCDWRRWGLQASSGVWKKGEKRVCKVFESR
jgi:hypothetical protein